MSAECMRRSHHWRFSGRVNTFADIFLHAHYVYTKQYTQTDIQLQNYIIVTNVYASDLDKLCIMCWAPVYGNVYGHNVTPKPQV